MAGNVADQVREEYKATGLRVLAQLQEAYYTLHFIHKSIDIVQKNIKILAIYLIGRGWELPKNIRGKNGKLDIYQK